MHLLTAVKGLSVRSCSAPPGRKQAEGQRDPAPSRARKRLREGGVITREDTRVRECDLIMCRVASSTRRRAIGGLTPASRAIATPRSSSNRARAKDEVIPGRGSSVRFTSCVVSRSWLFEYVRILIRYVRLRERQGCQRWRTFAAARREENARLEAGLHHRSAQRRREAPSAPVLLERTRKPSGSGCPFDSRDGQKSVVRIFGSSIRSVARHRGPPADLVTGALT